jgi:hypothetical protein
MVIFLISGAKKREKWEILREIGKFILKKCKNSFITTQIKKRHVCLSVIHQDINVIFHSKEKT